MSDYEMMTLDNESFVSIKELNLVIKKSATVSTEVLAIRMSSPVERFDYVFVGGLFLLFIEYGIRFNITGPIGERGDLFQSFSYQNELKQCLSQLNYMYHKDPHWIRIAGINLPDKKYHKSSLFAPILFIDKLLIDDLFKKLDDSVFREVSKDYIQGLNKESNFLEKEYFNRQENILTRLEKMPAIYSFVYCVMHEIARPFVGKSDINEVIRRINAIKSFSNQYVAGLYELGKNIVTHSSTGRGIITIGSYSIEKGRGRNIETFVLDLGKHGIVPTMIMELDDSSNEDNEDRQVLTNGYSLESFFSPGQSHRLLRQIRREMAHLGLIHFISLVRTNSGKCSVSSIGVNGEREFFRDGFDDELPCVGTNFHFSLPLAQDIELRSTNLEAADYHATIDSLAAMPRIYSIQDSIQISRLPRMDVTSRREEQELVDSVSLLEEFSYLAIDFRNVSITATSLLRVLAMFSERTDKGIIVFNINTETLSDLIMSNNTYFMQMKEIDSIPFWIKGKSILVYSQMTDNQYYFADVLYGDNVVAFQSINKIVNNTFPNYCTVSSDLNKGLLVDNSQDSPVCKFFYKSTLLPFDLVLDNGGTDLLFYSNLRVLINKPLVNS